jgi:genome maintenance exonuclease 1
MKKREWITDYFLQTAAYALAHNLQYNTNITQGVILICTPKLEFQEFIVKDNEFLWIQKKFIERVEKYKASSGNYK